MRETLLVVGVIVLIAWLIDRGWGLRGKRFRMPKPAPQSLKPTPHEAKKTTQSLRSDWLRLGRRS